MYKSQLLSSKCKTIKTINILEDGVGICKGPLTQAIFIAQFNEIFVAKKLQLQNGTAISVRHRRGLRCDSRNTVSLRSSFTFEQTNSFCLGNRRAPTFYTDKLH